jgi:5-aminopentanamidase
MNDQVRAAAVGPETTCVSCCQLSPVVGDLDGNLTRATEAIERAVSAGAQVVVLPELATSGYVFASLGEARSCAIDPGHPIFATWSELVSSTRSVLVVGFCEGGEDGHLFNSAAIVEGDGVRAVCRKTHLWGREIEYFDPGETIAPVVLTSVGSIGVCICYDLEFPEVPRTLAIEGAQLIAVPTNWPFSRRPEGERPAEVTIAMAAARTNKVAVACCDRAGSERGQRWNEASSIIGPEGWVLASADGSDRASADVALPDHRWTTTHALSDRRPGLYGALVSTASGGGRGPGSRPR